MKRALFTCLAVLVLIGEPLFAGAVYIPSPTSQANPDETWEVQVWASNTGLKTRRFSTYFIPENTDGTVRPEGEDPFTAVTELGTRLITGLGPGDSGMLELNGAPQLQLGAVLLLRDATGALLGTTPLPVIGSDNLLAEDVKVQLQNLQKTDAGNTSDLGVMNLSFEPQECGISVFRADGSQIGGTFVFTAPALSHRQFADVLGTLGETNINAARAEVSCAGPFYTYAVNRLHGPDRVMLVPPGGSLSSTLLRPGDVPPVPTLEREGNFFNPTNGDSFRQYPLPLDAGISYKRVVIDFDLFVNRYQTSLFHNVVGLRRDGGPPLFFSLFIRGDNNRTIVDRGDGTDTGIDGPWRQRQTYHLRLEYNTELGQLNIQVSQAGQVISDRTVTITFRDISGNGNPVVLLLGQTKVFDGAFFPPWGWSYSNLLVQAFEN